MRDQLTILNSFIHDVATGTWISSLLLLGLYHAEIRRPAWRDAFALAHPLEARFLILTWVSLAVIVFTGVVRAFTFKAFGWTGDIARERIRLLKVKHAILGVVFLAGTAYQVLLVYR
ncbi:MAG TPA: hypothetical protein VFE30_02030 [Anaeromyxobacteraceae bacterium]|jgi:putative copper export protein|nr:hypothetical protein [Anaeromyxobacteraceae bacterium]